MQWKQTEDNKTDDVEHPTRFAAQNNLAAKHVLH